MFIYNQIRAVFIFIWLSYMLFSLLITKLVKTYLLITLERKVIFFMCHVFLSGMDEQVYLYVLTERENCYKI